MGWYIEKLESPPGKTRSRVHVKKYYNGAICKEMKCTGNECGDCTCIIDEWCDFSPGKYNKIRIVGYPTKMVKTK